uniref:Uncharacterized LOC100180872 n=1 Tax=Ciona intestinalis TaxID=7719 RepID=H2XY12_CIOIN|nr:uncharacterized protein LOC100180872 [Ciona intestinalis]|eukprot:XP_002131786.1 uncharacterized protein LOC100180872 [Ciona intestinalis]
MRASATDSPSQNVPRTPLLRGNSVFTRHNSSPYWNTPALSDHTEHLLDQNVPRTPVSTTLLRNRLTPICSRTHELLTPGRTPASVVPNLITPVRKESVVIKGKYEVSNTAVSQERFQQVPEVANVNNKQDESLHSKKSVRNRDREDDSDLNECENTVEFCLFDTKDDTIWG